MLALNADPGVSDMAIPQESDYFRVTHQGDRTFKVDSSRNLTVSLENLTDDEGSVDETGSAPGSVRNAKALARTLQDICSEAESADLTAYKERMQKIEADSRKQRDEFEAHEKTKRTLALAGSVRPIGVSVEVPLSDDEYDTESFSGQSSELFMCC